MEILIILLLILLNGVFSMSEIALVSARKSRLDMAAKRGNRNAKAALAIAHSPNKFFSTVQIGITLIGIMTGVFSGENITNDIQALVERVNFLQPYAHSIAVTSVVIIITFFSLVLGELVPKRIGLANPEGIAKAVARPMNILSKITAPFVWMLTFTSDVLIRLFKIKPSSDSKVTEEEIKAIIREGADVGEVQEIEQDIVERVFSLGDRKVGSLMTHRNEVVGLHTSHTAEEIRAIVNSELHSVYPVFDRNRDQVTGIVLLKDLFAHLNTPGFKLADYTRMPQFITENTSAYQALEKFKETRIHYGIITDEYGQVQGIITMNDVLEALVGGVSDFYTEEFKLEEREDGSWLIDGLFPFPEFLHHFDLNELSQDYNFNTLSGLVLHELERIPSEGDKLVWLDFEIEIIDMDGVKIDKLLVRRLNA